MASHSWTDIEPLLYIHKYITSHDQYHILLFRDFCMYIRTCMCTCVYALVQEYVSHAQVHVHMYVHVYVGSIPYVYIHTCSSFLRTSILSSKPLDLQRDAQIQPTCVHTYVCTRFMLIIICMYICMHVCTYQIIHLNTYVYTYTHIIYMNEVRMYLMDMEGESQYLYVHT